MRFSGQLSPPSVDSALTTSPRSFSCQACMTASRWVALNRDGGSSVVGAERIAGAVERPDQNSRDSRCGALETVECFPQKSQAMRIGSPLIRGSSVRACWLDSAISVTHAERVSATVGALNVDGLHALSRKREQQGAWAKAGVALSQPGFLTDCLDAI